VYDLGDKMNQTVLTMIEQINQKLNQEYVQKKSESGILEKLRREFQ